MSTHCIEFIRLFNIKIKDKNGRGINQRIQFQLFANANI